MILQARQVQLLDLPPLTVHFGKRTSRLVQLQHFPPKLENMLRGGAIDSYSIKNNTLAYSDGQTLSSPTTVSPQAA